MNQDGPPAWLDDGPPDASYGVPAPAGNRRGNGNYPDKRREPPRFDVAAELESFYATITHPNARADLKALLPDNVPVEAFIRTAKVAVQANPGLLNPVWRASLTLALTRAASQGLLPDGKHGVLVPRYLEATSSYGVAWQPMVWGIVQLGRQTGAIKSIRAHIAFEGEPFEIEAGDEDRIVHKIVPEIVEAAYASAKTPDAFMEKVKAAYCVIEAPDGSKTKRWMTRSRLARVRAASKAAKGPWNGPFLDEMILKAVILATGKWINTDREAPAMRRFREALETDMEADFGEDGELLEAPGTNNAPALPAPTARLDALEDQILGKMTSEVLAGATAMAELVAAETQQPPASQTAQATPEEPADTRTAGTITAPADPPETPGDESEATKRRRQWVARQILDIAQMSHDALLDRERSADYRRRVDVLRQENAELADQR